MTEAKTLYPDKDIKTANKAPIFSDGMIVTADDLITAVHYPLGLMRSLNRAYFGCGIVCGLTVRKHYNGDNDSSCAFKVIVERGTAIDCNGYPVYLPADCELDLTPDPCDTDLASGNGNQELPKKSYCIAISRTLIDESPREDSEICESTQQPKTVYSRSREAARIRIFDIDDLPRDICKQQSRPSNRSEDEYGVCHCLKQCTDSDCCTDESWILLQCVDIDRCRLTLTDDEEPVYVKPIQCYCDYAYEPGGEYASDDTVQALQANLSELQSSTQSLKKDLEKTKAAAVDGKAMEEKFKKIDVHISQLGKDANALEKKLGDVTKVADVEKALEKKIKALEDKIGKLENGAKKAAQPAAKSTTTKTPPKSGNK